MSEKKIVRKILGEVIGILIEIHRDFYTYMVNLVEKKESEGKAARNAESTLAEREAVL